MTTSAAAAAAERLDDGAFEQSRAYIRRTAPLMPGGVSSGMRGRFRPTPLVFERSSGSRMVDIDGNEFIDYVAAFGPTLVGHSPPEVTQAIASQLDRGLLYGGQHTGEAELAERIVRCVPSAEQVLYCSTGSEATHAAARICRAATGRPVIIKFDGHYHGWLDPFLVNDPVNALAPLEDAPYPVRGPSYWPDPPDIAVCPWNDLDALRATVDGLAGQVAGVIMEPIPCNAGAVMPLAGYLEGVREICDREGIVLIFDEVVTGFRVALGGAQELLGVAPDVTILAKALGSGAPVSAVATRRSVMQAAHAGGYRHRGTYNGNVLAVAAANATLALLEREQGALYPRLDALGVRLAEGLRELAGRHGVPLVVNQVGSVIVVLCRVDGPVVNYRAVATSDRAWLSGWSEELVRHGVLTLHGEKWFVSGAHREGDVDETLVRADRAFARCA